MGGTQNDKKISIDYANVMSVGEVIIVQNRILSELKKKKQN
jgi:sporulation protein YlmC with PRC-barrel domain